MKTEFWGQNKMFHGMWFIGKYLASSDTCELYWTLTTALPASDSLIDVPW